MSRLRDLYEKELKTSLQTELKYKNVLQVPKLLKIVLNMGVGEAVSDSKKINAAIDDLTLISGQKPMLTQAKKSIATFKLRKGMKIGCKVTLRKERMYEFLDRLIGIAIPRERDFRGPETKSFDGRGNYSMGIKEHIIFPEIDYDKVDKIRGMDICISTSAIDDESGEALLRAMKFPFKI